MKNFSRYLTLLFFILLSPAFASVSGGGCGDDSDLQKAPYDLEKHRNNVNDAAIELFNYLNESGAKVALVGRAGGDLSQEDFRYPNVQKFTHAGFAWKSTQDGLWRFKHVLNVCAGSTSKIFVQSLAQFFNDDPHYYDVYVGYPSEELQDKIVAVLESSVAGDLLIPKYSNIANPFELEYQNSNGWILNVIASAQSGLETPREVQDYYIDRGYQPSQVYVGFLKGLGSIFVDNATLEDHTFGEKLSRWFNFVSASSLFEYIRQTDTLVDVRQICHLSGCNIPLVTLNK